MSMLAYACLTTVVVVTLGIAFHPVEAGDAQLTGAMLSEPRNLDRSPVPGGSESPSGSASESQEDPSADPSEEPDEEPEHPAAEEPPQDVAREVTIKAMSKRQLLLLERKKVEARLAREVPATDFVISSFNVLGSSHTSGNARGAAGVVRIRSAAALLARHGVDVVGFQELQADQYRAFLGAAGGAFDVYPGLAAGPLGVDNSIGWRTSVWTLQHAATVSIPYFDGRPRPMPYVLLKHNETGRMAWFANFHNPASNPKRGNNDGHRARATGIEVALVNRLTAESGYPVFVTGDMNDREVYFCRMTGGAPMIAANGGSNDGGCRPPPYPMPVDWIFGSSMVTFSNYVRDESALVRATSDHPMIVARVTLDGQDGIPTTE